MFEMIKHVRLFLISILLSVILSGIGSTINLVQAQNARAITWEELIPQEQVEFDDPFAELTEDQLYELSLVARYRELRQRGKLESGGESAQSEAKYVASLEAQGIDVDWLLSQRERVAKARGKQTDQDAGISGQSIRIPGYALPLTLDGGTLTEFLLVPWVGACIHTPPPPANQIIHVAFPRGTAPRDRFSPVQIKGRLEHNPADHLLYLIDGSRSIRATYTLTAETITDYKPTATDALSQVTIPEGALAGQHGWQRLQSQISLMFTSTMANIQEKPFSKAMLVGLLVAFLYGVLHTLGPGHSKAVIISYFVGEGGSLSRGIWMGIRIAVMHVLAAVVLVILTDVVVRQVGGNATGNFRIIRMISYCSITAIGGWMFWQAIQSYQAPRNFANHASSSLKSSVNDNNIDNMLYPNLRNEVFKTQSSNSLPTHRITWNCRCLDCFSDRGTDNWLSLAIGAVPCSGALVVLLYGLANNLLAVSIGMVIAISLGMAVTLSVIGIFAIIGRQTLKKKLAENSRQIRIMFGLKLVGAGIVFLLGSSLFMLTAIK